MTHSEEFWSRFWSKVDKTEDCWNWKGIVNSSRGYGYVKIGKKKQGIVHRVAYEKLVGKIPEGLVLDHLCRNRLCVNPAHLEPVTHRENLLRGNGWSGRNARKTHCLNGHPLDLNNLRKSDLVLGKRSCRPCFNNYMRVYRNSRNWWDRIRMDLGFELFLI